MKRHLLAFVAAVTLATPSSAQTAPELDPSVVQAVKEMMVAMKVSDVMAAAIQQMQQTIPQGMLNSNKQLIEGNSTMSPERKQQALAQLERDAPKVQAEVMALFSDPSLLDDMIAEMIPLYARSYSVDEIHQISAFYQSPVGQKMLATTPKLMGQMMEISNRVIIPRMQKLKAQNAKSDAGK